MFIKKRSLTVAICGEPNVGKSTLLNTLIGTKISITSHKQQTTRGSIKGILTNDSTGLQVVFTDTAGIFSGAKKNLEKAIVGTALSELKNPFTDVIMLTLDAQKYLHRKRLNDDILAQLQKKNTSDQGRVIVVVNKIDLIAKNDQILIASELFATGVFEEIFMISADNGRGIENLVNYFEQIAPEKSWDYDGEYVTDIGQNFLCAEIIREKIFLLSEQEIPYQITVETDKFEYLDEQTLEIFVTIYVAREGQRKIIIGKQGANIKQIRDMAIEDIKKLCQVEKIKLNTFVKVRDWLADSERYRYMRLDS